MMRRNFITGEWEEADDDLSGTYVVRDGQVVRLNGPPLRNSSKAICSKRPWVSSSVGVHPSRAQFVNQQAKKLGMDFEVNKRGFATATSAKGKKDAMKYFGMHNLDGGYGDICP